MNRDKKIELLKRLAVIAEHIYLTEYSCSKCPWTEDCIHGLCQEIEADALTWVKELETTPDPQQEIIHLQQETRSLQQTIRKIKEERQKLAAANQKLMVQVNSMVEVDRVEEGATITGVKLSFGG